MLKLNLGSHNKRIEGFTNVDVLDLPNVDIRHDLTEFPYPFEDNSVDEILMEEFLEHIPFRYSVGVLKECHRILKEGGKLSIQVPDIKEMMFAYWNGQICECVAHKPKDKADGMAKLDCPDCKGYGRVHPNRWFYAFVGAQKHDYDTHRNIYTPEKMEAELEEAGFNKIDIGFDEFHWKIKARATK